MKGNRVQLYDAESIGQLIWPKSPEAQYAKKFLPQLMEHGTEHFFDNVKARLYALAIDDLVLPITVNNTEYDNSYVCSPYSHYISCAFEFLPKIQLKWLKPFLRYLIKGKSKVLKWGEINKIVTVNNWLLSTNLYPPMTSEQISTIQKFLVNKFPNHAISFRSINTIEHPKKIKALQNLGFKMVACKPVFLLDGGDKKPFETRIFKSDMKLYNKMDYEVIDIKNSDKQEIDRMLSLYRKLYVEKHSERSLQLNQHFLKLAIDSQFMNLKVLKKDGKIDAMLGYYVRNGVMTSPFVGYDATVPKELGLYRLLNTVLALEAKENGLLLNQSSGAATFKSLRRAKSSMEYTAVYTNHLSFRRRFPWTLLRGVINKIGMPLIQKFTK